MARWSAWCSRIGRNSSLIHRSATSASARSAFSRSTERPQRIDHPAAQPRHLDRHAVLVVGVIYERRHTREIKQFGGLAHVMPNYAIVFAIAMLSSAGLPLLNGFIGDSRSSRAHFEANKIWARLRCARHHLRRGLPAVALPAHHAREITNEKNRGLPDLTWARMGRLRAADPVGREHRRLTPSPTSIFSISPSRRSFTASHQSANTPLASLHRGQSPLSLVDRADCPPSSERH